MGEKLGEGGMAIVFKAQDLANHVEVVIKVPKQTALEDKTFLKRFAAENRALMDLRHPHIVRILHVGENDGWPFTVLQYLTGGDLDACRETFNGKLSLLNVSKWMPKIANALDFIHARGYIHRDVKPANILFNGQGQAFLGDFGVAKVVSDQAPKATKLTGTGIVLGTPDYMAPELILDHPLDGRVDQYALGMTVYECLAGRLPFKTSKPQAILVMQITEEVPPLEQFNPGISQAVSRTVMQALAKKPAGRFPSCTAFAESLLHAIEQSSVSAAPPTVQWPRPTVEVIDIDANPRRETVSRQTQTTASGPRSPRPTPRTITLDRTAARQQPESIWQDKRMVLASGAATLIVGLVILVVILRSFQSPEPSRVAQESSPPQTQTASTTIPMNQPDLSETAPDPPTSQNPLPPILPSPSKVEPMEPESPEPDPPMPEPPPVSKPEKPSKVEPIEPEPPEPDPPMPEPPPVSKPEKPALLIAPFDSDTARKTQQAWAGFLETEEFVEINSIRMSMVLIPPGEFLMGGDQSATEVARWERPEQYTREHPQHRVRITQPFYLGMYEVTQYEWQRVMGLNPSSFVAYRGRASGMSTSRFPVESVSWYDAIEYCNKLSQREGLAAYYRIADIERKDVSITKATVSMAGGNGYRLPTEAEWEYACRAGTTTPFHFGASNNGQAANINGTLKRTTTVGSYTANAFGLFDMHGNVREWCFDGFGENEYKNRSGTTNDPFNASVHDRRVLRGGNYSGSARDARSASRNWYFPGSRDFYIGGFRVARTP